MCLYCLTIPFTGKNVSLVVKKDELHKAVNVIHGQVFGIAKKINIAIFGKGLVGGTLINQIIENTKSVLERRKIQLNIFAIASSSKVILKCGWSFWELGTRFRRKWSSEFIC